MQAKSDIQAGERTQGGKYIRTTFGLLAVGQNFRRGDGVNGGSYDKVSETHAKLCTMADDAKPKSFGDGAKVLVYAQEAR